MSDTLTAKGIRGAVRFVVKFSERQCFFVERHEWTITEILSTVLDQPLHGFRQLRPPIFLDRTNLLVIVPMAPFCLFGGGCGAIATAYCAGTAAKFSLSVPVVGLPSLRDGEDLVT